MIPPPASSEHKKFLYSVALCFVVLLVVSGVMAEKGWFGSEPRILAADLSPEFDPQPFFLEIDQANALNPPGKTRKNPTYPDAPAPGTARFRTPSFADLDQELTATPGTRAARELLVRTKKGDVEAAEALYNGSVKKGFDEYQRAIFLNTVANILDRDYRLLENTAFLRFYDGRKKHKIEFGIILSGVTALRLYEANMGLSGVFGLLGHRSPKSDVVASLEATPILEGPNIFAFDIDLYNPKADMEKHTGETDFNDKTPAATHPADVARALQLRGIVSGVMTR